MRFSSAITSQAHMNQLGTVSFVATASCLRKESILSGLPASGAAPRCPTVIGRRGVAENVSEGIRRDGGQRCSFILCERVCCRMASEDYSASVCPPGCEAETRSASHVDVPSRTRDARAMTVDVRPRTGRAAPSPRPPR